MNLAHQCEEYLNKIFGVTVFLKKWKNSQKFPVYINEQYEFFKTTLAGVECVVFKNRNKDIPAPAILEKHLKLLQGQCAGVYVYLMDSISSYYRSALIAGHISFVVPYNQSYLPELGIHLKESFRQKLLQKKTLGPATQLVLLYLLRTPTNEHFIATEIAKALAYTKMTVSRAIKELELHGVVRIEKRGKENHIYFIRTKEDTWKTANFLLQNPVKRSVWITNLEFNRAIKKHACLAGLSALAEYSSLLAPVQSSYAISSRNWNTLVDSQSNEEANTIGFIPLNEDQVKLEIWSYDPLLFATDGIIDPLSLYLSLKEESDERVQIALEHVLKAYLW